MGISAIVNTDLRSRGYVPGIMGTTTTKKKPGSPKGQPKPRTRNVDAEFPSRLLAAMRVKNYTIKDVPAIAQGVGCSRAVLHQYLSGEKKTLDTLLFMDICYFLAADPYWLLYGDSRRPPRPR